MADGREREMDGREGWLDFELAWMRVSAATAPFRRLFYEFPLQSCWKPLKRRKSCLASCWSWCKRLIWIQTAFAFRPVQLESLFFWCREVGMAVMKWGLGGAGGRGGVLKVPGGSGASRRFYVNKPIMHLFFFAIDISSSSQRHSSSFRCRDSRMWQHVGEWEGQLKFVSALT